MTTNGSNTATQGFELDSRSALRTAWLIWIIAILMPLFMGLMMVVLHYLSGRSDIDANGSDVAGTILVVLLAFLAVSVVVGFALRRAWFFAPYYQGEAVSPRGYLGGMLLIWLPMEITMLAAVAMIFITGNFILPLLPIGMAVVLLITQYPRGSAMNKPVGNSDDPSTYEEPA